MGLDWHSRVPLSHEERLKIAREENPGASEEEVHSLVAEIPAYTAPCALVEAPKMKDRPTFDQDVREYVERRKAEARKSAKSSHPHEQFIEFWKNRTVEEEKADTADKYDCENCPLLADLQGADSTGSFFIGVTVSSCDFRGKRISADGALLLEVREGAYEERQPHEMMDYAEMLEDEIVALRSAGLLDKQTYEEYSAEWDADDFPLKDPKMSREEYEQSLHWREQNLRDAIHWLRTCAKRGIWMGTSY